MSVFILTWDDEQFVKAYQVEIEKCLLEMKWTYESAEMNTQSNVDHM